MRVLGIMAGGGQFPFLVAQGAKAQGIKVVACGFIKNTDPSLAKHVDASIIIPLGKLNTLINFFKQHGVTHICMAGTINKPRALEFKPDFRAAKLLFKLAKRKGDDILLRTIAEEMQHEGFTVIKPEEMAPSLKAPAGILTRQMITPELWEDIRFGWDAAKQIGQMDIGQCVIVKSGIVIAVEAIEGTDAAIIRAGELGGPGCTLVKTVKPTQDQRLDLPSIGQKTIELLIQYRYAGVAYEAEKTLFFDQEASIALANKHELFIAGIPSEPDAFLATNDLLPRA